MFLKMVKSALVRQKKPLLMIVLTMCLGISLATAMLNVMFDVGDKVNKELKSYGANLVIVPRGVSLLDEKYNLDDSSGSSNTMPIDKHLAEKDLPKIKMIFWAHNIVNFAPFLNTKIKTGKISATLVGTWFDKHLVLPTGDEADVGLTQMKSWWDIDGKQGDDADVYGVLVGKSLAEKLHLKPGDQFPVSSFDDLQKATLTVRGIVHSGGTEDDQIIAPLQLAQQLSGHTGLVQRVEVSALTTPENELARRAAQNPESLSRMEWDTWYCTAYISSIAYQLEEVIPGARVKAVLQVAESEGTILQKTQLLMTFLTLMTLACSALAISNLVMAIVIERSSEIGLLKALGATNLDIALMVFAEILCGACVGGIAGYLIGLGFAQIISHTVFGSVLNIQLLVIPLAAILVLTITLIGSLPALRILLRMNPREILHGR